MFAENASQGNVMMRSQDIFLRLRTAFNDLVNFKAWLDAQTDATLEGLGFTAQDLTFLRSAYADGSALQMIASNQYPPSSYPQPANTYNYLANATQVIGPA